MGHRRPTRPRAAAFLPATVAAAIAVVLLGTVARAAESPVLQADPPGAYLALHGPVSLAGVSPLPLAALPLGEYELTADGPGLPAIKGRLVRSVDGVFSRSWAGRGALLLPPGIVHLDRGETRGWALLGGGVAAAALAIVSEADRREARDDESQAEAAYRWALTEDAIRLARLDLLAATQEREDQEEVRNLWLGYLGATWLGAGLEALLFTPHPSVTRADSAHYLVTLPRAGRAGAALRSALMPGGGQRYWGRSGRATFFFTATAALAAAAIASHDAFLEARRDQDHAQRLFDEAQDENELRRARAELQDTADKVDNRDTVRWALVAATACVYVWNVVDAFGLGHEPELPGRPIESPGPEGEAPASPADEAGLSWSLAPRSDGFLFCATWRIP